MRVTDSEKTIALLEMMKKLLPGRDGVLPRKFLVKENVDQAIQRIRANTVDLDILANMIGLAEQREDSDNLLVGFDHNHGDIAVLIIGRRNPGDKTIQLINQFQGKKAEELYKKLTEKENDNHGNQA